MYFSLYLNMAIFDRESRISLMKIFSPGYDNERNYFKQIANAKIQNIITIVYVFRLSK